MIVLDEIFAEQEVIYVFGYGSLTWKPDFESDSQFTGYIKGYIRTFWQGSNWHRGTPDHPGRVCTLTERDNGVCWGLVYEVRGAEKIARCLDHLQLREQTVGCYDVNVVPVYRQPGVDLPPVQAIIYHALPGNDLWLGEASVEEQALDIATCHGHAGHDIEYLFRLCDWMREALPGVDDPELFGLERQVRWLIGRRREDVTPWKKLLRCAKFRALVRPSILRNSLSGA